MKISRCSLEGLLVIQPRVFEDERGWFMESFNQKSFEQACGAPVQFVQDNHSFSRQGVLRGLHYQLDPHAQGKLVRVTQGAVWDVAVDLRSNSPTLGDWFGLELSAENKTQLWIPGGFAHGFITLSETAEFLYKTTAFYDKASERAIVWDDADIAIAWPHASGVQDVKPLVSSKDAAATRFEQAQLFD
jgi:dTDP-4-dehydrorhamnose 3,5-epimerase